jgi:hypothetical protein
MTLYESTVASLFSHCPPLLSVCCVFLEGACMVTYAKTGMMSGMGRGAFDGKAGMQWAVDLVCKAIFNPAHTCKRANQV